MTTHGMTYTGEYFIWKGLKARCQNPKSTGFKNYGGRGISVCGRWNGSFEDFFSDVGARPSPNHTLDRYPNSNGNYEPGNVRWATWKEQQRNKRNNLFLVFNGERRTLAEWSDIFGLSQSAIGSRLAMGWTVRRALTAPRRAALPVLVVQPGQVWKHRDPRRNGTLIRIERIESPYAICQRASDSGRASRILLSRFKSTMIGYELVAA